MPKGFLKKRQKTWWISASSQDGVIGIRFIIPSETIRKPDKIWNNSTQDTDIRHEEKQFLEMKNKTSPMTAPAHCLEKVSRPQLRKRKSRETGSLPELKRCSWESGRGESCRNRTIKICRGSPKVFNWILTISRVYGNYPTPEKELPKMIIGHNTQS